jgi:hypothetical protein
MNSLKGIGCDHPHIALACGIGRCFEGTGALKTE